MSRRSSGRTRPATTRAGAAALAAKASALVELGRKYAVDCDLPSVAELALRHGLRV